jgi:hypothetical protein
VLEQVQRAERKVVEVHVGDQCRVDAWEVRDVDARRDEAFRHLSDAARENRVRQNELVVELHEHRGMTDPERREARVLARWSSRFEGRRPSRLHQRLGATRNEPGEQAHPIAAALHGGNEQASQDYGARAHQKNLIRSVPIHAASEIRGTWLICRPSIPKST